ncbi:hypothetical protein GWA97_06790 [Flavobacterium sp. LaA7.5]|nr:hypothetical protein [Flavobacterium salilacus subsp. altitudinum]
MKIITFLVTLLVCIITQNSFSQETVKDSAYVADYEQLKALYIKMLDTDSYQESSKLMKSFFQKMNKKDKTVLIHPDDYINWVKDNIEQTDFKSFTEAEFEWDIIKLLQKKSIEENQGYYDFLMKAISKHGATISSDVLMSVRRENPEKFGLPAEFKRQLKKD